MSSYMDMIERLALEKAQLQAKVDELKKELAKKPDDEDFRIQSRHYEQRIKELERINKNRCKAHLMSINKIDELEAKVEKLEQEKTTLIKLGQEDSRYQNLLSETQSLRAKVEELTDRIKWLEINWCNPNSEGE